MNEKRMNLVHESWIPVVDANYAPQMISLLEVFTRTDIVDMAVRPHERVALMRLLLCIAHAALEGPVSSGEIAGLSEHLPQQAQRYLDRWQESFWLYHPEKPFLQTPNIHKGGKSDKTGSDDECTPFSKLDFVLPSGGNAMLFDHVNMDAREWSLAELALALLPFQMFSPGGLIAQVFWNGQQTEKSSRDAPCVPASMLHTFLRGKNLLETVCLNTCAKNTLSLHYDPQDGEDWWGRPIWEQMPVSVTDTVAVHNATRTYVGRLVPLSRCVLLKEKGILLGEALTYPNCNNKDNFYPPEPSATMVLGGKDKEERRLLTYRSGRAVWRDLHAIVLRRETSAGPSGGIAPGGPLALNAVRPDVACDLMVLALARDQADITDALESIYPLNPALLDESGRRLYELGVQDAEKMVWQLNKAVESYRQILNPEWRRRVDLAGKDRAELLAKLHSKAQLHYWSAVENDLPLLMRTLEAENVQAKVVWQKHLFVHALNAYDRVCGQLSVRHVKAHAKGRGRIYPLKDTTSEEAQI